MQRKELCKFFVHTRRDGYESFTRYESLTGKAQKPMTSHGCMRFGYGKCYVFGHGKLLKQSILHTEANLK